MTEPFGPFTKAKTEAVQAAEQRMIVDALCLVNAARAPSPDALIVAIHTRDLEESAAFVKFIRCMPEALFGMLHGATWPAREEVGDAPLGKVIAAQGNVAFVRIGEP